MQYSPEFMIDLLGWSQESAIHDKTLFKTKHEDLGFRKAGHKFSSEGNEFLPVILVLAQSQTLAGSRLTGIQICKISSVWCCLLLCFLL